ncbi:hypothetical protein D1B31_14095 [Neobacillus notoginsengisoli]|uniref:Uncharacterized protein n=1 Tax=Neobacillus notoginsengisoli TaxID=1578198 RepID=A0A417YSV8_9BACI|nr:hypothetical protein [Neobacillus notoginsengisoli]RHW39084.1 hypothetical protein D1B31_14095 [Neobacillus notoginsengisoli]
MIEDFKVNKLFEGQIHNHHQFKLNVHGKDYLGLVKEESNEILWFHPYPTRHLEDELVEQIESHVHKKLKQHMEE